MNRIFHWEDGEHRFGELLQFVTLGTAIYGMMLMENGTIWAVEYSDLTIPHWAEPTK